MAYPTQQGMQPVAKPKSEKSRLGLLGLIFGIIGVVGGLFFGWTLPLAIVAIVLGFMARKKPKDDRSFALWAITTGFAGTVFSLGWFVYSILVLVMR